MRDVFIRFEFHCGLFSWADRVTREQGLTMKRWNFPTVAFSYFTQSLLHLCNWSLFEGLTFQSKLIWNLVSNFIFINPGIHMHVPVPIKAIEKLFTVALSAFFKLELWIRLQCVYLGFLIKNNFKEFLSRNSRTPTYLQWFIAVECFSVFEQKTWN